MQTTQDNLGKHYAHALSSIFLQLGSSKCYTFQIGGSLQGLPASVDHMVSGQLRDPPLVLLPDHNNGDRQSTTDPRGVP